jgi:hypothetical protein
MKPCVFEKGDDADIIYVLTNPMVVTLHKVARKWSVHSLLDLVAAASYHALIDTGALVTGMSNLQVAEYLLQRLPRSMEGVVFLDRDDAKQILLREGLRQLKLEDAGIDMSKRFTYFDQAHCTGMDIKQALNAQAALTLGKDMTFRDYAQGAYRMRGVGVGQTIELVVTPEVMGLIADYSGQVEPGRVEAAEAEEVRRCIVDVCGWLVKNQMQSEGKQDKLRVEQSLKNVWRKHAYRHLIASGAMAMGTAQQTEFAGVALETFIERLDFTISSSATAQVLIASL